jgi:hypothetical protein
MARRGFLALALSLAFAPGLALADPWKDESGNGRGRGPRYEERWSGRDKDHDRRDFGRGHNDQRNAWDRRDNDRRDSGRQTDRRDWGQERRNPIFDGGRR